ncbi:MAG: putative rane protein [bacterium]|nr:putative rane protein [bacterium]
MSYNRGVKERAAVVVAIVIVGAYAFAAALPPIWDTDVWWHLQLGEWIAVDHALPHTDLFSSVAPDRPWMTVNWIFELVLYGLHQSSGYLGMRLLVALTVVAGYALWLRFFWRQTRSWPAAIALSLLLIVLYDDRIRVRPHVFNLPAEALLVTFLVGGARLPTARAKLLFFLAFVAWANVHHPWSVLGVLAVGFAQAARLAFRSAEREPRSVGELATPVALAAAAVLVNPYGPRLLLAPLTNFANREAMASSGEFQPILTYLEGSGGAHHVVCALAPFVLLLAASGVVLVDVARRRRRDPERLAWLASGAAPLFYLAVSLTAMRFVYLCVAAAAWLATRVDWKRRGPRLAAGAAAGMLALVAYDYTVVRGHGSARALVRDLGVDIEPDRYPDSAVILARGAALSGPIFSDVGWGGYLLWFARAPRGVVADARYSMPPETFALVRQVELALHVDGATIVRAVEQLGAQVAVLPADAFPFDEWPAGWTRVAHDRISNTFLLDPAGLDAVARFVGAASASPATVADSADRFFGERYWQSHARRIAELEAAGTHEAVHELAEIERISARPGAAITRLRAHLRATPSCVIAATQLARILHDGGHRAEAFRLLAPAGGVPGLPAETEAWYQHLRDETAPH